MKLLTQNAKMKKSSQVVYNFGIPAYKSDRHDIITCPNALNCINGCYAKQGTYLWSPVKNAYENRLEVALSDNFVSLMSDEINKLLKKHKNNQLFIRINDSGDFFSNDYLVKWISIMTIFPQVKFYAYTKQVELFKNHKPLIPENFTVIFSLGGKQDKMIYREDDRHAKVFDSLEELLSNGYIDASNDDMIALNDTNHKIGLVYHGQKNINKTNWKKVG